MIDTWSKIRACQQGPIDDLKFEFEYLASIGCFLPSIHKLEEAVVDPDTIPDFFKYPDAFGVYPF